MAGALTPGFMVLQGNRLEDLRDLVLQWLMTQPLPPLQNDVFLVQSNGIAQWLKLALADWQGIGIAAGIEVQLPARLQWRVYRALLGNLPEHSRYDKQPLTWRLYDLFPQLIAEPVYAPLARFLAGEQTDRRRYQLAAQLADLFDQYQVYRADWLNDWAAGRDQLRDGLNHCQPLAEDARWQAALWRALIADIAAQCGETEAGSSRAQIHRQCIERAEALTPETRPRAIPARIIVFGITSLPQQQLEILAALSGCTQVVLCVHNPCRHYWGDIIEGRELFRREFRRHAAKPGIAQDALHADGNPLLASWGKQGRDYIRLLDQHDQRSQYEPLFVKNRLAIDLFQPPADATVLAGLQCDILELDSLAEARAANRLLSVTDRSVVFHLAHSPQREVEILHDQLLAAFSADHALAPRDVMVMVPDINTYAPHIQAVFGRIDRNDPRYIPFTIADQGVVQQQPLLLALAQMLSLDNQRYSVSTVLDWLAVPALRAAAGLSESDVEQLARWIDGANIRWGLSGEQRAALALPEWEQNSWLFGLRRMLLGYLAGDDFDWQGCASYGEVAGLSAEAAGGLYWLIERLLQMWEMLRQPRPALAWADYLRELLAALFVAQSDDEQLLLGELEQMLAEFVEQQRLSGRSEPLASAVVRDYWLAQFEQPGLSKRFLAGCVNFATLMPMRAIPFKRICLLGMNDGDFPRQRVVPDFDLMRRNGQYRPGDRSRRDDDRYLMLEALLSARQQLYISWVAYSVQDNSERLPSVLVNQLRDYIDGVWQSEQGDSACGQLSQHHPLTAFSSRYFPEQADCQWFSYGQEWQQVQRNVQLARQQPARDINRVSAAPYLWPEESRIRFSDLVACLKNPVDCYFRQRLGVDLSLRLNELADEEPFVPNALEQWQLRNRLLQAVLRDHQRHPLDAEQLAASVDFHSQRLHHEGELPMALFGDWVRQQLNQNVAEQFAAFLSASEGWQALPLQPFTDDQVSDEIDALYQRQEKFCRIVLVSNRLFSGGGGDRLKWQHVVRQWPLHLATQLWAGQPVNSVLIHQANPSVVLAGLEPAQAKQCWQQLLVFYRQALQTLQPTPIKTAMVVLTQQDNEKVWRETYEGKYNARGEREESLSLKRVWPDFDSLYAAGLVEAAAIFQPLLQARQAGEALADVVAQEPSA